MGLLCGGREFPGPLVFRGETAFREEARMYGKSLAEASLARRASDRDEPYFLPFSAFTAVSVWLTWSEASRLSYAKTTVPFCAIT